MAGIREKQCQQFSRDKQCHLDANYRYTWPGKDESFICEVCSKRLLNIANAIGLYIQLIPLER